MQLALDYSSDPPGCVRIENVSVAHAAVRHDGTQRDRILGVLMQHEGEWISALDFKRGRFGFHVDAVSQRIGDLRRAGHPIESTGRGNVASYRYGGTHEV